MEKGYSGPSNHSEGVGHQVFVSYNRRDRGVVEPLAAILESRLQPHRYSVWLDVWRLVPGKPWVEDAIVQLQTSESVVVCFGPGGLGDNQNREIRTALEEQNKRKIRVMGVFLPGGPAPEELKDLAFLFQNTWIDFRGGIDSIESDRAQRLEFARLMFGITGNQQIFERERRGNVEIEPAQEALEAREALEAPRAPAPANRADERNRIDPLIDNALRKLGHYVDDDSIAYFLGPGAMMEGSPPTPDSREMARRLFLEMRMITAEGPTTLLPGLDAAGAYYEVFENERSLEQKLKHWLTAADDATTPTKLRISETYKKLAILAALKHREIGRGASSRHRLIVSANFDVMLEWALSLAGVPFRRVVQCRSADVVHIQSFEGAGRGPTARSAARIEQDLTEALDTEQTQDQIQESLLKYANDPVLVDLRRDRDREPAIFDFADSAQSRYPSVVIYKVHGSVDINDSCAISTDQHLDLITARYRSQIVPDEIKAVISNSPMLFLGFGLFDASLRYIYYMLRDEFDANKKVRYLLPFGNENLETDIRVAMQQALQLRKNIFALDVSSSDFLQLLIDRVESTRTSGP